MSIIRDYEGIWTYDTIDTMKLDEMKRICESDGLPVEILATNFDFGYAGRDSGRWVVKFLDKIARVLGDVSGEIVCRIDDDDLEDPYFEYYTVKSGVLYRQLGEIIRHNAEPFHQ